MLYVRKTKKMGRGIFTSKDIKEGELFESAELILVPLKEEEFIQKTVVDRYYYYVDDDWCGIALGFGSLYNHSQKPNAYWEYDNKNKTFAYYALKDIKARSQIFIDYGYDPVKKHGKML